jgi:glycosyltransferase involved in cell wall biosynthesis
MTPLVSILVPVYNAERYLRETLASLLAQTYSNFEIIALDDGSTDGSLAILQELAAKDARFKISTRPNQGIAATRNELISLATGEFLAVNDADDLSSPQRLEKQVAYLQAHPECVAVGSRMKMIDPQGRYVGEHFATTAHDGIDACNLTGSGAIGHSSAMMRASAVRTVGGYRAAFEPSEDLDLWLRLAEVGELANLPEALADYRLHAESVSYKRYEKQVRGARQAITEAIRRRGYPPREFPPEIPKRRLVYAHWAALALYCGNLRGARRYAWRAVVRSPLILQHWKLLIRSIIGGSKFA